MADGLAIWAARILPSIVPNAASSSGPTISNDGCFERNTAGVVYPASLNSATVCFLRCASDSHACSKYASVTLSIVANVGAGGWLSNGARRSVADAAVTTATRSDRCDRSDTLDCKFDVPSSGHHGLSRSPVCLVGRRLATQCRTGERAGEPVITTGVKFLAEQLALLSLEFNTSLHCSRSLPSHPSGIRACLDTTRVRFPVQSRAGPVLTN